MLPQPPPNAPVPPPSAAEILSRRKWKALWITGVVSMSAVVIMAVVTARRQRIHANRAEAFSNLRSMSLAMFEFDAAYGGYPDDLTIPTVQANTGTTLPLGTKSSNDYFRQLIAAEITLSEGIFYARIHGCKKPDYRISPTEALAKGEVGFSYVLDTDNHRHPEQPLVATPLIPGTNRFDPKPFHGEAMVMVAGGYTKTLRIEANGEVLDASGKHILDVANPMWGGKAPRIAWPE